MAKIDIFKNPKGVVNFLRSLINDQAEEAIERAADIVEEEYQLFFDYAGGQGKTGILERARTERKERGSGRTKRISVFVPRAEFGPNLVFHVLDEGTDEPLGPAKAYGLRAWPMTFPRQTKYGNTPMSREGNALLNKAVSREDIVYRPVIKRNIGARNFTDQILKDAQERLRDEGLDRFVNLETSEQSE